MLKRDHGPREYFMMRGDNTVVITFISKQLSLCSAVVVFHEGTEFVLVMS